MAEPLTNDEPYEPSMDPEDAEEVTGATRPQDPRGQPIGVRFAEAPLNGRERSAHRLAYEKRLEQVLDKLSIDRPLTDEEASYATIGALLLIMKESRSRSLQLKATAALVHMQDKKMLAPREVEGTVIKGPRPSLPT